ncbi:MAG: hypothetical protein KAI38_02080, partial [Candidatus Latescibacteria bacterium]|nr:hypothetical protein [Candidatus Latescibacterota bacterium]
ISRKVREERQEIITLVLRFVKVFIAEPSVDSIKRFLIFRRDARPKRSIEETIWKLGSAFGVAHQEPFSNGGQNALDNTGDRMYLRYNGSCFPEGTRSCAPTS